jgi:hypothetical protein
MQKLLAGFLALMFTAVATSPAYARQCAGVRMPDTVDVDGTTLHLNGLGIREATVLQVNVYVAGLYVETVSRNANEILGSDTRKRITLRFVHNVSRDEINGALREGFHNNAPGTDAAKINRLIGWTTAMTDGQTMSFTYIPGRGTEFVVNGTSKGTIEGADFARSVFSLYIGRRPPNPGLRTGLLGGRCG